MTLTILWYTASGHHPDVVAEHRARSPWYLTKTTPSFADMLAKLRRVIIGPQPASEPRKSSHEEDAHVMKSVFQIRRFLTEQLTSGSIGEGLSGSLRAMRAACRKYADNTYKSERHDWDWGWPSARVSQFERALGELRGVFGVHIALIAARYRLDVPSSLIVILPAPDVDTDEPDRYDGPPTRGGRAVRLHPPGTGPRGTDLPPEWIDDDL
jgi:hypothetical protein